VTYAFIDCEQITPRPRILNVDDCLDYITNRVMPDWSVEIKGALEGLWFSSSVAGSQKATDQIAFSCQACGILESITVGDIARHMIMIMLQDFIDPWTFNQKNLMKCCKEFLLSGGKQIPFCAYNTIGYREQARAQLEAAEPERRRARAERRKYEPRPAGYVPVLASGDGLESGGLMSSPDTVKQCCARLYESDFGRLLLGDSFHPGGTKLTERLGELLGLDAQSRVLDIASGTATSALFLADRFGVGVHCGSHNVEQSNAAATARGLDKAC
jgi:hypothetical protein